METCKICGKRFVKSRWTQKSRSNRYTYLCSYACFSKNVKALFLLFSVPIIILGFITLAISTDIEIFPLTAFITGLGVILIGLFFMFTGIYGYLTTIS